MYTFILARCSLSGLEPFFGDFSAARPRFVARLAPSDTLSRDGLASVRVRPRRGRRPALARWQGRVSTVSHTRPNHSPVSQPAPRLRGPPHAPNQSPVSLRRPVCGGLVPPAPYVFARTPAPIYCYLLLLLGLLPYLLPSNRLITLYILVPIRPYVPAVLYTMAGLRAV